MSKNTKNRGKSPARPKGKEEEISVDKRLAGLERMVASIASAVGKLSKKDPPPAPRRLAPAAPRPQAPRAPGPPRELYRPPAHRDSVRTLKLPVWNEPNTFIDDRQRTKLALNFGYDVKSGEGYHSHAYAAISRNIAQYNAVKELVRSHPEKKIIDFLGSVRTSHPRYASLSIRGTTYRPSFVTVMANLTDKDHERIRNCRAAQDQKPRHWMFHELGVDTVDKAVDAVIAEYTGETLLLNQCVYYLSPTQLEKLTQAFAAVVVVAFDYRQGGIFVDGQQKVSEISSYGTVKVEVDGGETYEHSPIGWFFRGPKDGKGRRLLAYDQRRIHRFGKKGEDGQVFVLTKARGPITQSIPVGPLSIHDLTQHNIRQTGSLVLSDASYEVTSYFGDLTVSTGETVTACVPYSMLVCIDREMAKSVLNSSPLPGVVRKIASILTREFPAYSSIHSFVLTSVVPVFYRNAMTSSAAKINGTFSPKGVTGILDFMFGGKNVVHKAKALQASVIGGEYGSTPEMRMLVTLVIFLGILVMGGAAWIFVLYNATGWVYAALAGLILLIFVAAPSKVRLVLIGAGLAFGLTRLPLLAHGRPVVNGIGDDEFDFLNPHLHTMCAASPPDPGVTEHQREMIVVREPWIKVDEMEEQDRPVVARMLPGVPKTAGNPVFYGPGDGDALIKGMRARVAARYTAPPVRSSAPKLESALSKLREAAGAAYDAGTELAAQVAEATLEWAGDQMEPLLGEAGYGRTWQDLVNQESVVKARFGPESDDYHAVCREALSHYSDDELVWEWLQSRPYVTAVKDRLWQVYLESASDTFTAKDAKKKGFVKLEPMAHGKDPRIIMGESDKSLVKANAWAQKMAHSFAKVYDHQSNYFYVSKVTPEVVEDWIQDKVAAGASFIASDVKRWSSACGKEVMLADAVEDEKCGMPAYMAAAALHSFVNGIFVTSRSGAIVKIPEWVATDGDAKTSVRNTRVNITLHAIAMSSVYHGDKRYGRVDETITHLFGGAVNGDDMLGYMMPEFLARCATPFDEIGAFIKEVYGYYGFHLGELQISHSVVGMEFCSRVFYEHKTDDGATKAKMGLKIGRTLLRMGWSTTVDAVVSAKTKVQAYSKSLAKFIAYAKDGFATPIVDAVMLGWQAELENLRKEFVHTDEDIVRVFILTIQDIADGNNAYGLSKDLGLTPTCWDDEFTSEFNTLLESALMGSRLRWTDYVGQPKILAMARDFGVSMLRQESVCTETNIASRLGHYNVDQVAAVQRIRTKVLTRLDEGADVVLTPEEIRYLMRLGGLISE